MPRNIYDIHIAKLVHVFMYQQSWKQKIICPSIQKRPESNKFFHSNILNLHTPKFLWAEKHFSCHWAKIQKLITSLWYLVINSSIVYNPLHVETFQPNWHFYVCINIFSKRGFFLLVVQARQGKSCPAAFDGEIFSMSVRLSVF